ncbi:hypothetical protein EB796_008601 [Bugula neritina]|uniref:Uncharacterized protein n=1 Tax=Bugula neritina TaxID=10212 RepID=A0A7J7K584_BUGNE|nr:hypothetical protein EB796_008601 [Bugula neritina]
MQLSPYRLEESDSASLDVFYDTRTCSSDWAKTRKAVTLNDNFCCGGSFLSLYHYTCPRCQCNLTISSLSAGYEGSWPLYKMFREDRSAPIDYSISYDSNTTDCGLAMQECHKVCSTQNFKYFAQGLSTQLSFYGSASHGNSGTSPYTVSLANFVCDQMKKEVSVPIKVMVTEKVTQCPVETTATVQGSNDLCCRNDIGLSLWIPDNSRFTPSQCNANSIWSHIFG